MKKVVSLLLMLVIACTMLTACSDPVYDEFENFLNVEMVDVNANYEKIKEEAGSWSNLTTDEEFITSLKDVLLPLVDDSLAKVNAIVLETEEVKVVRAKYVKVMERYKEGFTLILEGFEEQSEEKLNEGNDKITEAIELLDEYNAALEELAEQVGAEVEY